MKATIKNSSHDGKIRQNRKENHFNKQVSAICYIDGEFKEAVTLRLYCSNSYAWYACIWVFGKEAYVSGGGRVGGCNSCGGFHKPSAVSAYAIEDAGIVLDSDIDGRGDSAIDEAVKAIAVCAYPGVKESDVFIHHANA